MLDPVVEERSIGETCQCVVERLVSQVDRECVPFGKGGLEGMGLGAQSREKPTHADHHERKQRYRQTCQNGNVRRGPCPTRDEQDRGSNEARNRDKRQSTPLDAGCSTGPTVSTSDRGMQCRGPKKDVAEQPPRVDRVAGAIASVLNQEVVDEVSDEHREQGPRQQSVNR